MATIDEKLSVLSEMAKEFNKENLLWAVGASLMLYFKGCVDDFNDIDIMVSNDDAEKMETILNHMGKALPYEKGNYETKCFRKFIINGVEIDMIGGFAIVKDGVVYDCDLNKLQIAEYIEVNGEKIPVHSVTLWRKYYELMGRTNKVEIIDRKIYGR